MAKKKNSEVLLADNETGELLNVDEGIEVQYTKQYGVGCDCHARFLQISVLVKHDDIAFIILKPETNALFAEDMNFTGFRVNFRFQKIRFDFTIRLGRPHKKSIFLSLDQPLCCPCFKQIHYAVTSVP